MNKDKKINISAKYPRLKEVFEKDFEACYFAPVQRSYYLAKKNGGYLFFNSETQVFNYLSDLRDKGEH